MSKQQLQLSPSPYRLTLHGTYPLVDRIHELEEAYNRLQDVESQKDAFLTALSHELKTPLTAILGWANLVRDMDNPPHTVQALQTIERNALRLLRMIEDLLLYTECIAGRLTSQLAPVALRAACEEVISQVTATLDTPAACAIEVPATLTIMADPAYLRQILEHLLSNAFKFTPPEGQVRISAAEREEWIVVELIDTGIGIAPDDLESVYRIFWQADMSTTRRHNGAGIGLALVKELVALHGGGIMVSSPGVNQGTHFSLCFPRILAPSAAEGGSPATPR